MSHRYLKNLIIMALVGIAAFVIIFYRIEPSSKKDVSKSGDRHSLAGKATPKKVLGIKGFEMVSNNIGSEVGEMPYFEGVQLKDVESSIDWLGVNGFGTEEGVVLLRQLANRVSTLQAIKLIEMAKASILSDVAQAVLLDVITSAYRYDYNVLTGAFESSDEWGVVIAEYVADAIQDPLGGQSFLEALEFAHFMGKSSQETYDIISEAIDRRPELLTSEEGLRLLLKNSQHSGSIMADVLKKVNASKDSVLALNRDIVSVVSSYLEDDSFTSQEQYEVREQLLYYYKENEIDLSNNSFAPEVVAFDSDDPVSGAIGLDDLAESNPALYSEAIRRIDSHEESYSALNMSLTERGYMREQKLRVIAKRDLVEAELLQNAIESLAVDRLGILNRAYDIASRLSEPESFYAQYAESSELNKKLNDDLGDATLGEDIKLVIRSKLSLHKSF